MKIQFFSIGLICLFTALNLVSVVSNAESISRPVPKPIVPVKPPPQAVKRPAPPVEAKKDKPPVVEDRVMGAQPKTPSHSSQPSTGRPTTEGKISTDQKTNDISKILVEQSPKIEKTHIDEVKELMKREQFAIESDAMKGLLAEHASFEGSLGGRSNPNHHTSAKFETNLAKRLVGEDRFKRKDLKLEDIKDLEALTCKNGKDGKGGCGNSRFNLSCRRISGFLVAASAAGLSAAAIGEAFYSFLHVELDPEQEKDRKSIEVPTKDGTLVVKVDKPVAGEEISPAKESN